MTTSTGLNAALARFAERLHGLIGPDHHIASPLGAWLLLALCGAPDSAEVADALGLDPDTAAGVAASLLDHPHALVGSAAAVWHRPEYARALTEWLHSLPAGVTTGDLPGQRELNAWAREHTYGLIEEFPVRVRPQTALVLATALATRVSWQTPFELVPAAALGADSAWAAAVPTALRTPPARGRGPAPGHRQYIAATDRAGDVAVHQASSPWGEYPNEQGLVVTSVIADATVPAGDVLAAAYRLATTSVADTGAVRRRSLFELPLGGAPLWTVREERVRTRAPDGREERCEAVLPAWSATSEHDLDRAELGIPAAARTLAARLGLPGYTYEAKQAAMARYSRYGFEAAAVTAMAVALSMVVAPQGVLRVAELRFGHPYAVVAVAEQWQQGEGGERVPGPWHGVPVFSGWVTRAEDADVPRPEAGGEPAGG